MGFLSAYSGTRRIDLDGHYYVVVKECLSMMEKQRADKALGSTQTIDMSGRHAATIDTSAYTLEMVAASIVEWNLDEEDGTIWPLSPEPVKRRSIERLPAPVFERIYQEIDALNGPRSKDEQVRFPAGELRGDPDGDGGPAEPGDVLDRSAVVAAPWASPFGP